MDRRDPTWWMCPELKAAASLPNSEYLLVLQRIKEGYRADREAAAELAAKEKEAETERQAEEAAAELAARQEAAKKQAEEAKDEWEQAQAAASIGAPVGYAPLPVPVSYDQHVRFYGVPRVFIGVPNIPP